MKAVSLTIIITATIALAVDSNVAFLATDIARLFRKRFEFASRDVGVTGDQWRVLGRIAAHPGINQGALAGLLEVEAITAGRMVDRLEKRGLVERRPDPQDRRVWLLHITPPAESLLEVLRERLGRVIAVATETFSAQELDQLTALMDRLRDQLLAPGAEPLEVATDG